MIDTIRLSLRDYEIIDDSKFTKDKGRIIPDIDKITGQTKIIDTGQTLLYTCQGEPVYGDKVYFNHSLFQFDLKAYNGFHNPSVKFSVPKVYTGGENNLKSVGRQGLKTVFKTIESALKESGIKTNPETGIITRLDTNTDIQTDEPFYNYEDIFNTIHFKRSKIETQYSKKGITEGFLFGNDSRQACIYDKAKESDLMSNLARFENRVLKGRVFKSIYGFNEASKIFENYDNIKQIHRASLQDLFKYNLEEIDKNKEVPITTKDRAYLYYDFLKNKGVRNYKNLFFETLMTDPFINIDVLFEIIEEKEPGHKNLRSVKSKYSKKYRQLQIYKQAYLDIKNPKFLKLYNEIKTKLFKAC